MIVPLIDFVIGLPVLLVLMWYFDTWPRGIEFLLAPFFIGLAVLTALGSGLCSRPSTSGSATCAT